MGSRWWYCREFIGYSFNNLVRTGLVRLESDGQFARQRRKEAGDLADARFD